MSTRTITRTDHRSSPESYELVDRNGELDPELVSIGVRPSPSWQSSAALGHDSKPQGLEEKSLCARDKRAGGTEKRTSPEVEQWIQAEVESRMERIREYRESVEERRSESEARHIIENL